MEDKVVKLEDLSVIKDYIDENDSKIRSELTNYIDENDSEISSQLTNYVDDKFNGANKAVSFINYSSMIASLNTLGNTSYNVGQNIMVITLEVPDLWVSEITEEINPYTYVSDDDFINELKTNGSVQVGYYKLSALETQKVDLNDYIKKDSITLTLKDNGAYTLTIAKE